MNTVHKVFVFDMRIRWNVEFAFYRVQITHFMSLINLFDWQISILHDKDRDHILFILDNRNPIIDYADATFLFASCR